MPRQPIDYDDDDDGAQDWGDFDPEDYGWTDDEWQELMDIYEANDPGELLDMFPELADFSDWMDELDFLDDIQDYDDDDFYIG